MAVSKFGSALFALGALVLTASCASHAAQPVIPLSVDSVETHRVGDQLLRVIRHNMELSPQLQLERLSVPEVALLESLDIRSVSLGDEVLDFTQAAGVYLDDLSVGESSVDMRFEYYPREGAETLLVQCVVQVTEKALSAPDCDLY